MSSARLASRRVLPDTATWCPTGTPSSRTLPTVSSATAYIHRRHHKFVFQEVLISLQTPCGEFPRFNIISSSITNAFGCTQSMPEMTEVLPFPKPAFISAHTVHAVCQFDIERNGGSIMQVKRRLASAFSSALSSVSSDCSQHSAASAACRRVHTNPTVRLPQLTTLPVAGGPHPLAGGCHPRTLLANGRGGVFPFGPCHYCAPRPGSGSSCMPGSGARLVTCGTSNITISLCIHLLCYQ